MLSTWLSQNRAPIELSFLNTTTLDSRVIFSRSSSATYRDNTGTRQTVGVNVPRFNHSVAGVPLGLLIEEQRTNILLNSATLSTQSVSVTAQAYTLSFEGTGTVTLSGTSTAGPLVGTGATNRVSLTFTPTAGTLTLTVTGSVTAAQLEAGGFGTSWIPTTGSQATRAADTAYFNHAPGTQGTALVIARRPTNVTGSPRLLGTDGAGQPGPASISGGSQVSAWNGSTNLVHTGAAMADGDRIKVGSSWATGRRALTRGGATPVTDVNSPGSWTKIFLGSSNGASSFLNGTIESVSLFSIELPTARLQALTT